uniref:DUF4767 domain-containing protein n=1 Tax=Rhabditophanes sp. KR3021 TaxID=114890 RepID=A0AC35TSC7_9BILA
MVYSLFRKSLTKAHKQGATNSENVQNSLSPSGYKFKYNSNQNIAAVQVTDTSFEGAQFLRVSSAQKNVFIYTTKDNVEKRIIFDKTDDANKIPACVRPLFRILLPKLDNKDIN